MLVCAEVLQLELFGWALCGFAIYKTIKLILKNYKIHNGILVFIPGLNLIEVVWC